jgi:hypothetical protein
VPFSFTTGTRVGQVGTVTLTAGDGQLTAEWSAVSSADGYEVQYKASSSSTWLDASDVTSPSVITGLSSDTAYDVRVRAWDERGVGAWSATASATTAWGTLIDAGFENGTTDATIGSPWSNVVQATYSTADKKVGAKSAKIVGSGTVAGGLFDASAATSMTHDTAEYRAWINPTTTNTGFSIMESTTSASLPAAADRAVSMRFSNAGNVEIYTNRSGYTGYTQNAYTAVGTYATGWMQYRIVLDFTDQTYTLSRRAAEGDSWTYLKASGASVNDIPFRGVNTISACPGIGFKSGTSTDALYVDEVRYKDGA